MGGDALLEIPGREGWTDGIRTEETQNMHGASSVIRRKDMVQRDP